MKSYFIYLAMLCFVSWSASVTAGKIYKWTDKEGNVHYTQTPPPQSTANSKPEQMKVSGAASVQPEKRGKYYYCDTNQLPNLSRSKAASNISMLREDIANWQYSIQQQQQQRVDEMKRLSQYNGYRSSSYGNSINDTVSRYDKKIAVIQCKVDWAEKKLADYKQDTGKITQRYNDINKALDEIEERKVKDCGTDDRTGWVAVDDKYREYQRCVKNYDREINRLKRQQRDAKRDYELIKSE